MWIPKNDGYTRHVICNPITGKYASLPDLTTYPDSRGSFKVRSYLQTIQGIGREASADSDIRWSCKLGKEDRLSH